jgi:hypothetical protein
MNCLKQALILYVFLDVAVSTDAHRTRAHNMANNGLRGSPIKIGKPTLHPTYPDWDYLYETYADYPDSSNHPTFFPTASDRTTHPPTAEDHDNGNEARELPKNARNHANIPTHHPTFPDWGYLYESSANNRYPTTFPTYSDHDIDNSYPPTVFDWDYNSPTYYPTTDEESDHSSCETGTFFQLDIALDYDGHDLIWKLIKLPDEILYQGDGYKDGMRYDDVAEGCLEPGDYEYTIYDSGGDGLKDPGYYALKLCRGACQIVASGGDFGYNETTAFTVLKVDETATPTMQPTLNWSTPPSSEYSPAPTILIPDSSSEDTDSFVDPFEKVISHSHENWVAIIDENFEHGFGYFVDDDTTAVLYDNFEGRTGVVAIQDGDAKSNSSVVSKTIRLGEAIGDGMVHSKFKVVFSYYAYSMEIGDSFCFEYSVDAGDTWQSEKCWTIATDFENDKWYDDVTVTFAPQNVAKLTLRFRCNASSRSDMVMIDSVQLSDLHD